MSDYEAVIEFLKKENKEITDSNALLTQECERYKKESADAKALYKVMESEFDKAKAELTAEIKETEFGRKLLASTVSDQCKKLEEKDNRIHQLYKKSDEQENTIERLNKQLSIMTEKYNRAEKQIAELAEEKRQAEEQLAEMQSADKSNTSKQNNIFKHIFGQDKK